MSSNPYLIKPIGPEYAGKISSLVSLLLQEDWCDVYKPQTIESYLQTFTPDYFKTSFQNGSMALGAFDGQHLIGIYVLKPEPGGVGFVDWLGVDKRYRKRGLASDLLAHGDTLALSHQLHFLYLYTEKQENISFYERRGFTLAAVFNNAWYGERESLLTKQLRPEPFTEIYVRAGKR